MSSTMILEEKDKFLLNFEGQDFSFEAKSFLKKRESASQALRKLNFPTTKEEEWKYTRVNGILKHPFSPQTAVNVPDIKHTLIPNWDGNLMVFINGFYSAKHSKIITDLDESDVVISTISEAKKKHTSIMDQLYGIVAGYKDSVFTALNTAYANDGLFLYLPKNTKLQEPIHVLFLSDGEDTSSQPRNFILAENGSKATVTISYQSLDDSPAFTNGVTEVIAKDNANISINKIQLENESTFHVSKEEIVQHTGSQVNINTITLSGKLVRNDLNFKLDGKNTTSNLNGLYITNDQQHVDNHSKVFHKKVGGVSNELYKGILSGKSTGVFNGKVFVEKEAQQTNAFQSNKNILLSDDATINSKPELEIYADDVKCSHGSTTGQFDEEAVFYLRARGIGEMSARKLLVSAFAGEVTEKIDHEITREYVEQMIQRKFQDINE